MAHPFRDLLNVHHTLKRIKLKLAADDVDLYIMSDEKMGDLGGLYIRLKRGDAVVTNCWSPEQLKRIMERPHVQEYVADKLRAALDEAASATPTNQPTPTDDE